MSRILPVLIMCMAVLSPAIPAHAQGIPTFDHVSRLMAQWRELQSAPSGTSMDPLQIPQSADDQLRALNAEMSLLRSRESNEKEKLGAFRSKVQEAGQSEYDALQEVHKARLADIQRRIEAIKATTQALRNVRTDVEEEAGGCEDGSTDAKGCNGKP